MTDITLTLDHHEFYYAVRGFANGSHLSQGVWEHIVFPAIRQMDDEFQDFLWWMLRRNHFDQYLDNRCGAEDYLHILAALHRVNRFKVRFVSHDTDDENVHECICYRFRGTFRPLRMTRQQNQIIGFNSFIPDEWLEGSEWIGMNAENEFVDDRHQDWWRDIHVYDEAE